MAPWTNTPSGTMTASVLTSPGATPPTACFTYKTDYPKPTLPSQEWCLIRVYAAGLNRAELRGRNNEAPALPEFGMWQAEYHPDPPDILGEEFVGEIEEAGEASGFRKGEKVCGLVYGGGKAYNGSYATHTICHKRRLYHLPQTTTLDWATLGAIPMSMITAYGSLFISASTSSTPGSTILIHGATSSVGIWAILLAKSRNCNVIATTRQPQKIDQLKAAGADHVFLEEGLLESVKEIAPKGVDTILELVGAEELTKLDLPLLKRHGNVVFTGVLSKVWETKSFTPALIPPTRKLTMWTVQEEDTEAIPGIIKEVVDKVESGEFKRDVFLDRVFELEKIGEAHAYMEESRAVGKVVVTV